jgi:hypothetical protein
MAPTTKSPFEGSDSPLRPVSLNPSHFRTGRWWLLGEGLLLVTLGIWGFGSAAAQPHVGAAGAPVGWLALTRAHSVVLLGFGLCAMVATIRRRPTVIVTGVGVVAFLLLFTIGTAAAARHTPWVLGFDLRDSVLHAALLAFNLALLIWLVPDALEGPAWVQRQGRAPGDPHRGRQSGPAGDQK